MRTLLVVFLLGLGASLPACVGADLGERPVFCNQWEPRCPEGYTCVPLTRDGKTEEVCQREGSAAEPGSADGSLSLSDGVPAP